MYPDAVARRILRPQPVDSPFVVSRGRLHLAPGGVDAGHPEKGLAPSEGFEDERIETKDTRGLIRRLPPVFDRQDFLDDVHLFLGKFPVVDFAVTPQGLGHYRLSSRIRLNNIAQELDVVFRLGGNGDQDRLFRSVDPGSDAEAIAIARDLSDWTLSRRRTSPDESAS